MTHRILKLANSTAYRRQRLIVSIADAVVLIDGSRHLESIASLLLMAQLAERKPIELFALALIRGYLCQALGANDPQFAQGSGSARRRGPD